MSNAEPRLIAFPGEEQFCECSVCVQLSRAKPLQNTGQLAVADAIPLLQTFHGTDLTQTTYQIEKTLRGVSVDGQVYEGRAKLLMPTPRSKPELQGIQYRSLQAGQKSGPENKQGSGCQHL
jgi:hypothetical protein